MVTSASMDSFFDAATSRAFSCRLSGKLMVITLISQYSQELARRQHAESKTSGILEIIPVMRDNIARRRRQSQFQNQLVIWIGQKRANQVEYRVLAGTGRQIIQER